MDKATELAALQAVLGWAIPHELVHCERPDFLLRAKCGATLGVEVTQLFSDSAEAKLRKLPGYVSALLDRRTSVHRRDERYIEVDEITLLTKERVNTCAVPAIIRKLPNFAGRLALLTKVIDRKSAKLLSYKKKCREVDLIIDDVGGLFGHEDFNDFAKPFHLGIDKLRLLRSGFREIYLLTTGQEGKRTYVPLIGNLFLADCFAYENLLRREKVPGRAVEALLVALFHTGHPDLTVKMADGELGIRRGAWELRYGVAEKSILDQTLLFHALHGEPLGRLIAQFSNGAVARGRRLVRRRRKVYAAMELALPARENNQSQTELPPTQNPGQRTIIANI